MAATLRRPAGAHIGNAAHLGRRGGEPAGASGQRPAMDLPKTLAAGLAVNRTLFGLNYLLRPQQARSSWIGRAAKKPGTQVMIRSQGVRDIALGAGALRAAA